MKVKCKPIKQTNVGLGYYINLYKFQTPQQKLVNTVKFLFAQP